MDIDWSESTTYVNEVIQSLKENDNMFGVRKIKDGMIVINKLGDVGYVLSSGMSLITVDYGHEFSNYPMSFFNDSDWVEENFKQIGTYKFDFDDEKTQSYIREMDESLLSKSEFYNGVDRAIVRKINEIIDKLNKE